jgi:hypothetical protein
MVNFQPDDPLLQVSFATEHMLKLEKLLASLPQAVFTASDALGWVYQKGGKQSTQSSRSSDLVLVTPDSSGHWRIVRQMWNQLP